MLKGVWVATDLTTRLYMYFGRHYASATVEDEWVTCHYAYRVETSLDWKAETDIVGNDLNSPARHCRTHDQSFEVKLSDLIG